MEAKNDLAALEVAGTTRFETPPDSIASSEAKVGTKATDSDYIKIRQILVPTDFSENACKALRYAFAFAKQFGSRLTVLHVVEPVTYPVGTDYFVAEVQNLGATLQAESQKRLTTFMAEQVEPVTSADALLRIGTAWQEITAVAKERDVDLIILATHGFTGLKHVLLGSTAEKVVRHAPCPVMTVRADEHEFI